MSDATFTFRVDDNLKTQFTQAAKNLDRSGAQLLRDFMRDVVIRQQDAQGYDNFLRQKVELAQASMIAGRGRSNEEVEAEFTARRARSLNSL